MRLVSGIVAVAVATSFVHFVDAAKLELSRNGAGSTPRIIENRVIVELGGVEPGIGIRDDKQVDIHARFLESLDRLLPPNSFRIGTQFDSDIFKGMTVEVSDIDDLKKIIGTEGVVAVRPIAIIDRPKFSTMSMTPADKTPGIYPPHIMTGVDKVHALDNIGQGINIGIIDTGVDYNHPALGKGFGPGYKVVGGYDYVGDNYNGLNQPIEDDDPLDECAGHGTHVAGILAADPDNEFNITGVAYGASLRAYRVFGCFGGSSEEILVKALLRAQEDGNDVINFSIGLTDGWTTGTVSVVAARIARAGRVVAVSAGNTGEEGAWYTSSPANGLDVISVASVENIADIPLFTMTTTLPDVGPIPYRWNDSLSSIPVDGNLTLPIYATSRDSSVTNDACDALPDSTPDLSGYATLVRRGTCSFATKVANVRAKGGKIIVFYNNGSAFVKINVNGYPYALLIQETDGLALLDAYLKGTNYTVSFPASGSVVEQNVATGGLASNFSSYGPTQSMDFKPAIAAPGGGILSTMPLKMGGYGILSGTSMSSPHIAGISALVLKAKGKGVAGNVRTLLQTTSTVVPATLEETSLSETLARVGAGQANVFNAITYETTVTPGELLLNDTAHWKTSHTIVIQNTGQTARTYTLRHVPAGTALSFRENSIQPAAGPVPLIDAPCNVKLSPEYLEVDSGQSASVMVTITPPTQVDTKRVPVVSGYIEIATSGETLRASYLGAATDLRTVRLLDTTPEVMGTGTPIIIDPNSNPQTAPRNYTFTSGDMPALGYRLVFGTARMTVDLVKPDLTIDGALNPEVPPPHSNAQTRKRGMSSNWLSSVIDSTLWRGNGASLDRTSSSYAQVPIVGQLAEHAFLTRHNAMSQLMFQEPINNTFVDGSPIPYGQYKILLRALKVGGDATKREDYESWLSPILGVVAPPSSSPTNSSAPP